MGDHDNGRVSSNDVTDLSAFSLFMQHEKRIGAFCAALKFKSVRESQENSGTLTQYVYKAEKDKSTHCIKSVLQI